MLTDGIPSGSISRVVVSTVDGSTLRLTSGDELRLLQVDSPGLSECYGEEAKSELNRLAPEGATVYIIADDELGEESQSGVLDGYAVVDGFFLNVELAKRGAVAPYFQGGREGLFADALLSAAMTARRQRQGMWGKCPQAKLDPPVGAMTGPR